MSAQYDKGYQDGYDAVMDDITAEERSRVLTLALIELREAVAAKRFDGGDALRAVTMMRGTAEMRDRYEREGITE